MKVSFKVCKNCPLSTTKFCGLETNILRCSVCHCIIKLKAKVGGKCPKFKTCKEMLFCKKKSFDN